MEGLEMQRISKVKFGFLLIQWSNIENCSGITIILFLGGLNYVVEVPLNGSIQKSVKLVCVVQKSNSSKGDWKLCLNLVRINLIKKIWKRKGKRKIIGGKKDKPLFYFIEWLHS